MNKNIFYISDFFVEQILGGGELNDDELIKSLKKQEFKIEKKQSHLVTIQDLKKSFDSIQNEAFELYLERLDPNKNIFLANEIKKFKEDIKNKLDIKDNLEIAYLVFKTYAERYQMRFDIQIEFLNNISDQDIRSSKIAWIYHDNP